VVSNKYVVYALKQVPSALFENGATSLDKSSSQLLECPIEEHEALLAADCSGDTCTAIVATANGALWQCGGLSAGRQLPVAHVSESFMHGKDALQLYTAVDSSLTTIFAASRQGTIVKLRRDGSVYVPIADVATLASLFSSPASGAAHGASRWHSLSVTSAGKVLLAIAAADHAGQQTHMVAAWDLLTGRLLGITPFRPNDAYGLTSCSASNVSLRGVVPSIPASGAELLPMQLPFELDAVV